MIVNSLPTEHTATMTGEPYLFFEFRQVAKLRVEGFTNEQIGEQVQSNNLFQYKTDKSVGRVLRAVLRRLDVLDDTLVEMFVRGSLNTSRLVALYAAAKTNLLFFKFLEQVYRKKLLLGDVSLTTKDARMFLVTKRQESPRVAAWSDSTVAKLGDVYLRILREAGLLTPDAKVVVPTVEGPLKEHLAIIGEYRFLRILMEEM